VRDLQLTCYIWSFLDLFYCVNGPQKSNGHTQHGSVINHHASTNSKNEKWGFSHTLIFSWHLKWTKGKELDGCRNLLKKYNLACHLVSNFIILAESLWGKQFCIEFDNWRQSHQSQADAYNQRSVWSWSGKLVRLYAYQQEEHYSRKRYHPLIVLESSGRSQPHDSAMQLWNWRITLIDGSFECLESDITPCAWRLSQIYWGNQLLLHYTH